MLTSPDPPSIHGKLTWTCRACASGVFNDLLEVGLDQDLEDRHAHPPSEAANPGIPYLPSGRLHSENKKQTSEYNKANTVIFCVWLLPLEKFVVSTLTL